MEFANYSEFATGPVLAVLLIVVFISLFIWKKSLKQKGSDIIFVGLTKSGKTYLVSKLIKPAAEPLTQTSIVSK